MPLRWIVAILIVAALITLAVSESLRRRPSVQVPLAFERLAEGVRDRDASSVLSAVHIDYDFTGKWPGLFNDKATARSSASRLLTQAFLMGRDSKPELTYTISAMQDLGDGRWEAIVDLAITGRPFQDAVPALKRHRFVLQRGSPITGRWRIVDHDPFEIRTSLY